MTPEAIRKRRERARRKDHPELGCARFYYNRDHMPDMLVQLGKLHPAEREDPAAISAAMGRLNDEWLRAWLAYVTRDNS